MQRENLQLAQVVQHLKANLDDLQEKEGKLEELMILIAAENERLLKIIDSLKAKLVDTDKRKSKQIENIASDLEDTKRSHSEREKKKLQHMPMKLIKTLIKCLKI